MNDDLIRFKKLLEYFVSHVEYCQRLYLREKKKGEILIPQHALALMNIPPVLFRQTEDWILMKFMSGNLKVLTL